MPVKTQSFARIHRFHDKVAISFSDTDTLYLTSEDAEAIAHELATFAANVQCKGEQWFATRVIRDGIAFNESDEKPKRALV